MAILRCRESFSIDVAGVPRAVTAGMLFDSDDPIVKGRERLFEPVESFMDRRTSAVEAATAAPGEKRTVRSKGAR